MKKDEISPDLIEDLKKLRDAFARGEVDQVVIFAEKAEESGRDRADGTVSEDEGAANNVPKAGKKDKKSVRNEFYTKISRPVGSMNRKEDITTIAVRIYSLVKKKGEEDTLEWEQEQREYKLEIAEEAVEKQQESYTKEKKKKKKKKPKNKMDIWDKIMVGLALLVFAPEAEAIFHKLDDMGKSLAEKIKEHFRMPEDVKKELDDIDKESDESNDSQTQKEIKDLESSSAQEFYDIAYSTLLKFAKQEKLQNPEAIARLGAAQTSLETGYGKHVVGKNYFGIKAKSGMPPTSSVRAKDSRR